MKTPRQRAEDIVKSGGQILMPVMVGEPPTPVRWDNRQRLIELIEKEIVLAIQEAKSADA